MLRKEIGDYLDCHKTTKKEETDYVLCGLGTTQLDEHPNAQTEEEVFVNQVSASDDVTHYKTKFSYNMNLETFYEPTMEIYDIGTSQATGVDAQRLFVRVDLFRPVEGHPNVFHARRFTVTVIVADIAGAGGQKIKVSGELGTVTDAEKGYFDTTKKEFLTELPEITETTEP